MKERQVETGVKILRNSYKNVMPTHMSFGHKSEVGACSGIEMQPLVGNLRAADAVALKAVTETKLERHGVGKVGSPVAGAEQNRAIEIERFYFVQKLGLFHDVADVLK